jgi:hypothetical protein
MFIRLDKWVLSGVEVPFVVFSHDTGLPTLCYRCPDLATNRVVI